MRSAVLLRLGMTNSTQAEIPRNSLLVRCRDLLTLVYRMHRGTLGSHGQQAADLQREPHSRQLIVGALQGRPISSRFGWNAVQRERKRERGKPAYDFSLSWG